MFGSVISALLLEVRPLWHEASKIVIATKINPAASSIRFRIRNSSRANFGCKPVFERQPHRYSRLSDLFADFCRCFGVDEGLGFKS